MSHRTRRTIEDQRSLSEAHRRDRGHHDNRSGRSRLRARAGTTGLLPMLAALAMLPCLGMECPPQTCDSIAVPPDRLGITCVQPANGAMNVPTNTTVRIEFSRPVDPATLVGWIRPQVDVTQNWSNNNTSLEMTFTSPLQPDTTYGIHLQSVRTSDGAELFNPMDVCFSTGSAVNCPDLSPQPCRPIDATDPNVPALADYAYTPPFAADSVWNTPIGPNPQIDPASGTMIARLAQTANQFNGLFLNVVGSAVPVYFADGNTPRVDVQLTDPFASQPVFQGVPIPAHAIPDCEDDNFMVVFDTSANRFFESWQVTRKDDGAWSGSLVRSIPGTGTGIGGVRASGFSLAAGLIWPHELQAGRIRHALLFAYSFTRSGVYIAPATSTDGAFNDPAAIPLGAHLQLDPTLDLDTLNLTPHERTIALALQEYGMVLGDTGGEVGLSVVHPYSFAGNPYQGLLPAEAVNQQAAGVVLDRIPADRFRVLRMNLTQQP
ncbi:MAG: Ig-like domain-containing protein [Phycisphaerae bacterium]